MSQMAFQMVEEDILASSIRRQMVLCSWLINDLESNSTGLYNVDEKIHQIELGIKRLCQRS